MEIFLLLLSSVLGLVIGGISKIKYAAGIAKILMGAVFGYVIFGISWYALILIPIFYIGESFGIGQPKGYAFNQAKFGPKITFNNYKYLDLEWWQPEFMRHRPYLSLALRGALFLIPTFILALPLATYIATKLPESTKINMWRWSEILQYPLALLPLYLLNQVNMSIY